MSDDETTILRLLSDGREHYGLDMVKASGGQLGRGSIYMTLRRMEFAGLLDSREEPAELIRLAQGQIPRRLYRLRAAQEGST